MPYRLRSKQTPKKSKVEKVQKKSVKPKVKPEKVETLEHATNERMLDKTLATNERMLEKGHIYFFYRPKVQIEHVHGIEEVQRLFVLLKPLSEMEHPNRLLILAKKKLPDTHLHEK